MEEEIARLKREYEEKKSFKKNQDGENSDLKEQSKEKVVVKAIDNEPIDKVTRCGLIYLTGTNNMFEEQRK